MCTEAYIKRFARSTSTVYDRRSLLCLTQVQLLARLDKPTRFRRYPATFHTFTFAYAPCQPEKLFALQPDDSAVVLGAVA